MAQSETSGGVPEGHEHAHPAAVAVPSTRPGPGRVKGRTARAGSDVDRERT